MLGYEFVNLTPEEVEARRDALNRAGRDGYLLPIVLLAGVFIVRSLSTIRSSDKDQKSFGRPNVLHIYGRRINWLLSDTYSSEFGPLQVQLFGLAYASVLLYIVVQGTGNDYMHVTKAFAHVAVSQFPVHYLLSVKHPSNPITLMTGLTHERLNAYHRLFGRVVHAFLITHGVLYVWFFVKMGVLGKRVNDWDVRYGLMALTTADAIGVLTLPLIRLRAYHKLFYRSHVVLSLFLVVVVWLHVPYTRSYVAQAGFFWMTNGIMRKGVMAEAAKVKCKKAGGRLVELTATLGGGLNWEDWVPGVHGYLDKGGFGPKTPFTVVDARERDGKTELVFVVRDLGGPMTALLGQVAAKEKILDLDVEGPYGEAQHYFKDVLERVNDYTLVVAGGVGATYSLPIYLALAEKRQDSSRIKFVWIVQNLEDASWGMDLLRGKTKRNVQIYVTQGKEEDKAASAISLPGISVLVAGSRPKLAHAVETILGPVGKEYQPASIFVCGPGGLSSSLRDAVAPYVREGRKVRWYEEQFGFGGS